MAKVALWIIWQVVTQSPFLMLATGYRFGYVLLATGYNQRSRGLEIGFRRNLWRRYQDGRAGREKDGDSQTGLEFLPHFCSQR